MKLRALGLVGALGIAAALASAGPVQADQHHGGHGGRSYGHGSYHSGRSYGPNYSHRSYGYGPYRHHGYYRPYRSWYGYPPASGYGGYGYGYGAGYGYGSGYGDGYGYPEPGYVPYRPYCGPRVRVGIGFGW
jgi:hypothetical protein